MKSLLLILLAATPLGAQTQAPRSLVEFTQLAPDDHKVAGFVLPRPAFLNIEALGALADGRRDAWRADAWILETGTRAVVWSLRNSKTSSTTKGLVRYAGPIRLPAGTYEAHFASAAAGTSLEQDRAVEKFVFRITGDGRPARARELKDGVNGVTDLAFVRFDPDSGLSRTGFELARPTAVELIAIGALNQNDRYDFGWIQQAESRATVWQLTYDSTEAAGGSSWNRVARDTLTLPAGRYVATWVASANHGPDDRTRLPAYDPSLRGLTLRVADEASRRAIRRFPWAPVPDSQSIAAITGPGDGENRTQPFGLRRAVEVRIYAVGECSDDQGDPDDGAWLLELGTGQHVWDMKCELARPAGGSSKNRMVDTLIPLKPGNYALAWKSDGSHSAKGGWNSKPPWEPKYWGVSLFPASGVLLPGIVGPVERDTSGILAEIARVRNSQHVRRYFSVDVATPVRIRAEGESSGGEMADFGWVETGKGLKVWVMTFGSTRHAGGAEKNRLADTTVTLQPGRYVLHYQTDDSHAYGAWNSRAPDEPEAWGVVVRRSQ